MQCLERRIRLSFLHPFQLNMFHITGTMNKIAKKWGNQTNGFYNPLVVSLVFLIQHSQVSCQIGCINLEAQVIICSMPLLYPSLLTSIVEVIDTPIADRWADVRRIFILGFFEF